MDHGLSYVLRNIIHSCISNTDPSILELYFGLYLQGLYSSLSLKTLLVRVGILS
jgi:hypothetical protein